MQYYQMNEEQLVSYFNNQLNDEDKSNEEQGRKFGVLWSSLMNIFEICKVRFSFVFIILLICHFINLFFSILNKDWRLFFIGIILLVAVCLFSVGECTVLYYKRKQYDKRIIADERKVQVIKGGEVVEIDVGQLQCGDRLILAKGTVLPADSRVIMADNLYANEEEIFGRTISSLKSANGLEEENLYPEQQSNMVWKGTYITEGYGEAIVVAVGEDCFVEKIGYRKKTTQKSAIYNQKNNIGKITTIIYFALSVLLLVFSGALTGRWLEALLVFSSFLTLFVIEPSSFITEWTYYNTAEQLFEKKELVRNIQAFDGMNKEKELYVLPSDLLDNTAVYDEVLNINGTEATNRIFINEVKACFGSAKIIFSQSEGETFAVASGYWKEMLPYIKAMDESLKGYIAEYEKHGYMVGAICAKEIYFTQKEAKSSEFYGELTLRCLVLRKIQPDETRYEELTRLKKSGMKVCLVKEYSDEISNYIAGYCDVKIIEESALPNNTYSFPAKSDYAVFSNASQIQKRNAKIIFDRDSHPIHTIYEIKCMICGIERSLNFLYILLIGLMAGSFVCFLKNMDPIVAFPILMLHPLLIFLCHHIVHSVKNCNQSKLSLVIGGLFGIMIFVSALILASGSVAAWGFSFVIYAALLYLRRAVKSAWDKKELIGLALVLVLAILICLFVEFNVMVALLFATFPALATILIDLFY